jgi:hypothetical protein
MATILPFLKDRSVFEPEVTQAMSKAFDAVCQALQLPDTAAREREAVAVRIIEWARRGERDPARLSERVLHDAGVALEREPGKPAAAPDRAQPQSAVQKGQAV